MKATIIERLRHWLFGTHAFYFSHKLTAKKPYECIICQEESDVY